MGLDNIFEKSMQVLNVIWGNFNFQATRTPYNKPNANLNAKTNYYGGV